MIIKIAYCIPSLYSVSGMEKTLATKVNYFADHLNFEITVILTDGKGKPFAFPLSNKIDVINLDINYDQIWGYNVFKKTIFYFIKQIIYRKKLTTVLNQIKPDITVSMLRREINFISRINDGSKKVGEMHFNRANYRDFNTKGKYIGLKGVLAKLWMGQLISNLKRLDHFVVLSYEDMNQWPELNNISVIYNPNDIFPDLVSDCTSSKIVAAGRFVNQKGFDLLLDAWKIVSEKHPDWSLSIYGPGSKNSFLDQIKRNGIENSCFLHEAVKDLSPKFVESSIFAFSSRYEGFGMVITEAMACGLPPVAFACPCGPKDIIDNYKNGILVEPENIIELADKLIYLIENPQIRKEMGKNALVKAQRFRIEVIAKEWEQLFTEILK